MLRFKKSLNKKNPQQINVEDSLKKATTYSPTNVVPSAQIGLTSLFGMVRGEPYRNNHLKSFGVCSDLTSST